MTTETFEPPSNPSKGKQRAEPRLPLPKTTAVKGGASSVKKAKPTRRGVRIEEVETHPDPLAPTTLRSGKGMSHIPRDDDEVHALEQQDDERVSDDSSPSEMDIDDDSDNRPLMKVKRSRKRAAGQAQTATSNQVADPIVISSDEVEPTGDVITIEDTPPPPASVIGQGGTLDAWSLIHPAVYGNNLHENPGSQYDPATVSDVDMQYIYPWPLT